jgi:hypothetical protein
MMKMREREENKKEKERGITVVEKASSCGPKVEIGAGARRQARALLRARAA